MMDDVNKNDVMVRLLGATTSNVDGIEVVIPGAAFIVYSISHISAFFTELL